MHEMCNDTRILVCCLKPLEKHLEMVTFLFLVLLSLSQSLCPDVGYGP